jgi:hypothetical protein
MKYLPDCAYWIYLLKLFTQIKLIERIYLLKLFTQIKLIEQNKRENNYEAYIRNII